MKIGKKRIRKRNIVLSFYKVVRVLSWIVKFGVFYKLRNELILRGSWLYVFKSFGKICVIKIKFVC